MIADLAETRAFRLAVADAAPDGTVAELAKLAGARAFWLAVTDGTVAELAELAEFAELAKLAGGGAFPLAAAALPCVIAAGAAAREFAAVGDGDGDDDTDVGSAAETDPPCPWPNGS